MDDQVFKLISHIPVKEMTPGYLSKIIHTGKNTINIIDVKAGSVSPLHRHFHHQLAFVLQGEFDMTVNGVTQRLHTGLYADIPPDVEHGGVAVTDCRLLDIFSPERDDFKDA